MSWLSSLFRRKEAAAANPDRETLDGWLRDAYQRGLQGNFADAQRLYLELLQHDPRDADALYFMGVIAMTEGRDTEAADYFRRAIDVRSNDPALWFALGIACHNERHLAEATEAFRTGLGLQPANTAMRNNLSGVLIDLGRGEEGRLQMEQLLASGFESGQLQYNLGHVYRDQRRIDDAIRACRRSLELSAEDSRFFTNYLLTLNYSERHDAATLFAEHQRFGSRFAMPYVAPQPDPVWPRRLRVGYVSPDFRSHVVACFVEPILAQHDPAKVEVFCYYNHRWDDAVTERLRGLAEHWLACVYMTDQELAARIRADRIDILVDLTGHTGDNRLLVFAAKPAPVQMSYLGYPNTTGISAIDYRISDARADPPADDRFSVERVLRPWPTYFCYRPLAICPDPGPLPALTAGHVTFGCFNNLPKISDGFLDAAARVLVAVPGSRLRLKSRALSIVHVADQVRERFVRAGIDLRRVDIRGWEPTVESHIGAYRAIDIALDSFPYNGATTTCEALWMGVPVVTLSGDRHAGRMGSSLLTAVGLGELVASDVAGFVEKCVTLAADLDKLAALREGLRERMRGSPITDEKGFVGALENAYAEVWQEKITPSAGLHRPSHEGIAILLLRASALRAAGKTLEAEAACKEILGAQPDHVEALTALWDLSYETGNHGVAVEWLRRGLAQNEGVARLHYMMGYSLLGQSNPRDAAVAFRKAVTLEPGMAKGHNNLGCALEAMGQIEEAMACYRTAVAADPQLADALYNLGNATRQLGKAEEAARHIAAALQLDGRRADWKCNLGDLLFEQLELDRSVQSYSEAIDINPAETRAYVGRAQALEELGFAERSAADLEKAMQLNPADERVHSHWLLSQLYRKGEGAAEMLDLHRAWARRHARDFGWQAARAEHERRPERRLNIGYVSADFKRHSVAYFVEPLLAAHDRARYKIFCYSGAARPDEVTRRIRECCEEWRDISRLSDDWVAEQMRADRIDILVDLAGHTGSGRMLLFARKPAPVQVTWLGYPGTTGLAALDYRITDPIADPEGAADGAYVEKLHRLPAGFLCYGPPSDCPAVVEPPCLGSGRVTFGCFNHLPKLTPATVALWARLLEAVPQARLLLKSFGLSAQSARDALLEQFAAHGIGVERLLLRGPQESLAGHLAAYGEVDIALDVFPYNGTTTTCEALWMGVPVITLAGGTHVSRVGASILSQAGMPDLVAASPEEYLRKACALAADRPRLQSLRAGMRARLQGTPLLDATAFARSIEGAYDGMWRRWQETGEETKMPLRLHIGGTSVLPGWKILNAIPGPGVDYTGDCSDLSQFADESVDEIYASHVLEHVGLLKLPGTFAGIHRVLKKGGAARISVPDFELLCRMSLDPRYNAEQRFNLMVMVFGAQHDAFDFHYVGFTFEFLRDYLLQAGFSSIERVQEIGLLDDTSTTKFNGIPISLNVVALK